MYLMHESARIKNKFNDTKPPMEQLVLALTSAVAALYTIREKNARKGLLGRKEYNMKREQLH